MLFLTCTCFGTQKIEYKIIGNQFWFPLNWNWFPTSIIQNILFCVPYKMEKNIGLEQHEAE